MARSPNSCCSGNTTLHLLSRERQDFRRGGVLKLDFFVFSLKFLSKTFLILKRIQRDIFINVRRYSLKVPVAGVRF